MRPRLDRRESPDDLPRRIERLPGLPLRPASARAILAAPADSPGAAPPRWAELDPGYALHQLTGGVDPIDLVASRPWWPQACEESVARLWRHGVAVACAARRLAAEAGRDDAARLAAVGLLHNLGLWALAAAAPELLEAWFALERGEARREAERRWFGREASAVGRDLAERWGCDPTLVDATWLASDRHADLAGCAEDPAGLSLIRRAIAWAERTPWGLDGPGSAEPAAPDVRLRLLIAEVQIRCGGDFVEPDATPHEQRVSRAHAALLGRVAVMERGIEARDRFLKVLADGDPADNLATWADRAALAWCAEPEVTAAAVSELPPPARPDATLVPLGRRGRPAVTVQLRAGEHRPAPSLDDHPALDAWHAWADLLADRDRLAYRLDAATRALRGRHEFEAADQGRARLESLAEFAGGAGHELNNPLAVIQGRAQLLMVREHDPIALRSLRIIVGQVQRAHRILRDLIYVARPPSPRPRPCQPGDVLRSAVRDLQDEAEARGVRLSYEEGEPGVWAWADPEPIRHAAEVLARNALEATPRGGSVRVAGRSLADRLEWTVRDGGPGVDARSARHLFDPFYCGREAGRGLGLGLPRVARWLRIAGGDLAWKSAPGGGTIFQASLPHLPAPPAEPMPSRVDVPVAARA